MIVADVAGPEQGADGADDQESGMSRETWRGRGKLGEDAMGGGGLQVPTESPGALGLVASAGLR